MSEERRRDEKRRGALRWGGFALASSVALMLIKFFAYLLTGSTAVLSDALESVVNIVTSGFTLFAVWLSHMPHDTNHPYGHGRVEYFSLGLEGLFVAGAGVSIVIVSTPKLLWATEQPQNLVEGAWLTLGISVLAWLSGTALVRAGKRNNWSSIEADGHHIRSDALTSFAAFLGLGLVLLFDLPWIDPAVAMAMAFWLIFSGVKMARQAVAGLMDEADPVLLDEIAQILEQQRKPGWVAPHRARVHRLGAMIHFDLHLVFPRYWSLEVTHQATLDIEASLRDRFGASAESMIHMEPCTDISCSYCDVVDCPVRAAAFSGRTAWRGVEIAHTKRPRRTSSPDLSPQNPPSSPPEANHHAPIPPAH